MTSSAIANRHKDCMPCRIVSGIGVFGMGVYVWKQAKTRSHPGGRMAMYGLAAVAAGIGITRLVDIYPFGRSKDEPQN